MQFKPELIEKILSGQKTQTRRPVKPGDQIFTMGISPRGWEVRDRNNRRIYGCHRDYAVCPGRGKKQVARIRILDIRREDVRDIILPESWFEGFPDPRSFLKVWCVFYDPPGVHIVESAWDDWYTPLFLRPDHLYDAWALTFELVR